MKIADLKAGMTAELEEVELTEKGEERPVTTKFGQKLKVCNCFVKDESGTIKISLWNDAIARFNKGDRLSIKGAVVDWYKGQLQLKVLRTTVLDLLP